MIAGLAPEALLDSYDQERGAAADENLLNSTRSTDFITPKSEVSKDFRNAVLSLAGTHGFARLLVNSGRLSVPAHLVDSPLNTPDSATFEGRLQPGAPVADAPVQHEGQDSWLLNHVGGSFSLLLFVESAEALDAVARAEVAALAAGPIPAHTLLVTKQPGTAPAGCTLVVDHQGLAAQRFDALPGTAYLLRPDQHVAGRWRSLTDGVVSAALARATANDLESPR